jgi:hypothetical protein
MCRRVACEACRKPTFAGCGRHIEQVLGDVPIADRCRCHERAPSDPTTVAPSDAAKGRSLFDRLFSR